MGFNLDEMPDDPNMIAGDYDNLLVTESKETKNKAGNPMVVLTIQDEEKREATFFIGLEAKSAWRLKPIARACGLDLSDIKWSEFQGKRFGAKVTKDDKGFYGLSEHREAPEAVPAKKTAPRATAARPSPNVDPVDGEDAGDQIPF